MTCVSAKKSWGPFHVRPEPCSLSVWSPVHMVLHVLEVQTLYDFSSFEQASLRIFKQTLRLTHKNRDRPKDRPWDIKTYSQKEAQTDRQTIRQTDRQTKTDERQEKHADRPPGIETDNQTDRQTVKETAKQEDGKVDRHQSVAMLVIGLVASLPYRLF